ncbi:Heat_shock protein 70 [Hexamita inflata]|uniref:Heat shock protein 70 n=1 Tax=Hexamita inflata TaxID=28002 RepID=A0AA86PHR4_9EUKA|nr:Heat shock protein 70 [Hexamita inflata]CAI9939689.1 Heat shock protein 70 [Hexamita inflata]CAI9972225.1 Heat shock protein 70 [Hexamita inflata]
MISLLYLTLSINERAENIIGIDLGTTYSCVAISRGGQVDIIPNEIGNRITPSYVAFTETGERLVGDAAKNQAPQNPENTIFDIKRLIGRRFVDDSVQRDIKHFPYKIIDVESKPYVEVTEFDPKTKKPSVKRYSPEEISAFILQKMRQIAEDYLGETVQKAIVTVPAYFSDAQRAATKDAGKIAGLDIVRIINEPTAASLAFGLDKKGERTILTYDLGGGTFDVSILQIENGVFEVLSTNGDTHLGGEDFDHRVVDYFVQVFKQKTGKDLGDKSNKRGYARLKREVENAKRILSSQQMTKIEIEALVEGVDFSESLTRAKFEELNMDLFKKTMKPVELVLKDASLSVEDIDEVVLVGGSTRIPKIQELLKMHFGKPPNKSIHPDEAVGAGAAVQAAVLSGSSDHDILLIDVTPLTLGVETVGGVMTPIIERNTYIPVKKTKTFSTMSDGQTFVNVTIFEGERAMVKDNNQLGQFQLEGIPAMPRGQAQIEVTFELDANGMLTVTASEKSSGQENEIVIKNDRNRLTEEQIDKMVKDAEASAEEDKKARDIANLRNNLQQMIFDTKDRLDSEKDGNILDEINDDDKDRLEEVCDEMDDWLQENEDTEDKKIIQDQIDKLDGVVRPIIRKYTKKETKKAVEDDDDDDLDYKDEL